MAILVYNPYIAPLICTAVCFSSPKICGGVNSPRTRPFAKLLLEHISSLDMTYTYHRPSTMPKMTQENPAAIVRGFTQPCSHEPSYSSGIS